MTGGSRHAAAETGGPRGPRRPARGARAVAIEALAQWLDSGEFPERLLERVRDDRAFIMELVLGVARQKRLLEWVIGRYARRRPSASVTASLLAGIYQMLMLDTVADYAAVHETVAAVKAGPEPGAAGFVNGVLRSLQRDRQTLRREIESLPAGVRWSHPDALVERWTRRYGEARTGALCEWNNRRPHVTLRINPIRTSLPEFQRALLAAGVQAEPHPFAPEASLVLAHGSRVPDLPGFTEGWFSVQDPSTAVAPALLDPGPGQRVLDACAAPGGKTFVLAERMRGRGTLWAADVSPGRLRRLEENLKRMGLEWVQVRRADAASPLLGRMCGGEGFDRILLDVPCSTTGVLRRRPDARWRFSPERLNQLTRIQQAMLNNAATLLRPGGRLVYSTCSLEPEEGTELVRAWLRGRPEFRLLEERSLFPPDTQTDGVYAAALCCGG